VNSRLAIEYLTAHQQAVSTVYFSFPTNVFYQPVTSVILAFASSLTHSLNIESISAFAVALVAIDNS
jgi:hypothetical protein